MSHFYRAGFSLAHEQKHCGKHMSFLFQHQCFSDIKEKKKKTPQMHMMIYILKAECLQL